jgi:hypothetical protein
MKIYLLFSIDHSKCETAQLMAAYRNKSSAQSKCAELNEKELDSYGYFVEEEDLLD